MTDDATPEGAPDRRAAPLPDAPTMADAGIASGAIGEGPEALAFAERIVDAVRTPLLVLDLDLRVVAANTSFYQTFALGPERTVGRIVYDLEDGLWDDPRLRELLEDALPAEHPAAEVGHGSQRTLLIHARRLTDHRRILLTLEDVTERRRTERALRESEERFALFAENAREYAVIGMDPDGRITTWSPSAERMLGWTKAEALGKPGAMIFTEEDRAAGAPEREFATARADGSALDERLHVRKDGSRFWGTGVMVALRDDGVRGYAKVLRDNTRRKDAEAALRASERTAQARLDELEATYATAPVGLCVLDRDLRYVRINQRLADTNGLPVEAHLGRTLREVVPALAGEMEPALRRLIETGEPVLDVEATGETAAEPGVERTWVQSWRPLRDGDGEVVGINVVVEDVTERRRVERAVREVEERFRTYADAAPALLWVTDRSGRATFFSRAWYDLTGQTEREALGAGWLDAVHPADRGRARDSLLGANDREGPFRVDYRLRRHDGAYRWALGIGRALAGDDGAFAGHVGSVVDIDDRKRAEEALRQLNETLEARVEGRTREVRALARALTLAEQEERRRIAHVLHEDLQQILHGAQIKAALGETAQVDALLDEAIAATRRLAHELSPPLLRGRNLAELLEWLAARKRDVYGLEVDLDVRDDVSVPEEHLRILLYQLLRELLFNVVKHAGTARARIVAEEVGGGVRIVVEDEGAGFESDTLGASGAAAGLGLPSVRERLELVGGRLSIESAPGAGTRVTIEVPASRDRGAGDAPERT